MTRQAGMQPGATSPKAGRFQAAKPLPEPEPALWRIPTMPASPTVTLHWDRCGRLFEDAELTRPTPLQIFERAGGEDNDDED